MVLVAKVALICRKVWSIVNQWLMKPYHVCVKRKIRDRITLKTNQLEVYFQIHFHFFLLKLWHILKSTLTFENFQAHLFKTFDGSLFILLFFFSSILYVVGANLASIHEWDVFTERVADGIRFIMEGREQKMECPRGTSNLTFLVCEVQYQYSRINITIKRIISQSFIGSMEGFI